MRGKTSLFNPLVRGRPTTHVRSDPQKRATKQHSPTPRNSQKDNTPPHFPEGEYWRFSVPLGACNLCRRLPTKRSFCKAVAPKNNVLEAICEGKCRKFLQAAFSDSLEPEAGPWAPSQ